MSMTGLMTPEAFLADGPVAIYRHYDRSGELLYIGITSNPTRRWLQHLETSRWAGRVTASTVHWLDDRRAARVAEAQAIVGERPLFNRSRPPSAEPMAERRQSYLLTGVSGLPRRVPCRTVPGSFCIACGPDVDLWRDELTQRINNRIEYVQ